MNILTTSRLTFLAPLVGALLYVLATQVNALADVRSVCVIYPDIREPYRTVFSNLIKGIEAELGSDVKRQALRDEFNPQTLENWLSEEGVGTVIALGSRGLKAVADLPEDFRVVAGAVLKAPDDARFPVVTLHPAPLVLFDRLRELAPRVSRVTVVYNPQRTGWLMERARKAAKDLGLTLNLIPVQDRREAAVQYRDFLTGARTDTDAVWLLQDPSTTDARTVLPLILKEAWNRNLVVFSSNPAYVKRGVLFALYPDNVGMGRTLGQMALRATSTDRLKLRGELPITDLLIAVNVRTADHLGLELTSRQKRGFDLVFPPP